MKPGPATSALSTSSERRQLRRDQLGQRARIGSGALGEHHRRIGGEIAMRRIARRLDRHRLAVEAGRQRALAFESVEDGVEMRGEAGVKGHIKSGFVKGSARLRRCARRFEGAAPLSVIGPPLPSSRAKGLRRLRQPPDVAIFVPEDARLRLPQGAGHGRGHHFGVDRRITVEPAAQGQIGERAQSDGDPFANPALAAARAEQSPGRITSSRSKPSPSSAASISPLVRR